MDMYKNAVVIAIEGGEGTGKGTLLRQLKEVYPSALFIQEPGWGTARAKEIREEIMSGEKSEDVLIELFAKARAEITPAIPEGTKLIFSDRSVLSNLVYQTSQHKVSDVLEKNKEIVDGFRLPDYVVLLTGDVNKIQERLHTSTREKNWLDYKELEFHKDVDLKYNQLVRELYNGETSIILDNTDLEYSLNPTRVVEWINQAVLE